MRAKSIDWFLNIIKDIIVHNFLVIGIIGWTVLITYLSTTVQPLINIIFIVAIGMFLFAFIMIIVVKRALEKIIRSDYENMYIKYRECAQNATKYEFASFDFYTLDQILDIEKSMKNDSKPSECLITIYTARLESEEADNKICQTVYANLKSGIKYRVYYLKGIPKERQIKLYGKENLIEYPGDPYDDVELDLAAEFDVIVFERSNGDKRGFFSLNFSISSTPRPCTQGFICENRCHYENDNLLYKKMRDDSAELLLYTLREWDSKYVERES